MHEHVVIRVHVTADCVFISFVEDMEWCEPPLLISQRPCQRYAFKLSYFKCVNLQNGNLCVAMALYLIECIHLVTVASCLLDSLSIGSEEETFLFIQNDVNMLCDVLNI
eukprot:441864_1